MQRVVLLIVVSAITLQFDSFGCVSKLLVHNNFDTAAFATHAVEPQHIISAGWSAHMLFAYGSQAACRYHAT
jgi:hypothetical protein